MTGCGVDDGRATGRALGEGELLGPGGAAAGNLGGAIHGHTADGRDTGSVSLARAAEGARRLVLARRRLGDIASDATEVRLQVNYVPANDADIVAADQAEGVAGGTRVIELLGNQSVATGYSVGGAGGRCRSSDVAE